MPSPRRKIPEWKKKVDNALWKYKECEFKLKDSMLALEKLTLTGQRVTPSYVLQEGSHGGPTHFQAEQITLNKIHCEETIEYCNSYRTHIEESINYLYGYDPEKLKMIERYWWTTHNRHVYVRTKLVLLVLPFLSQGNVGNRPNPTFYAWREEIYKKVADLFGYR